MKPIRIYLLVMMISLISCDSGTIDFIKVYYRVPGILTPYPAFCVDYLFIEDNNIREKEINDHTFLKAFEAHLNTLKPIHKNPTVDSRVFMFIHYKDGSIDTLCIGEYMGICVNGTVMEENKEFHQLIMDEIDFYDKEKYDRLYGNN